MLNIRLFKISTASLDWLNFYAEISLAETPTKASQLKSQIQLTLIMLSKSKNSFCYNFWINNVEQLTKSTVFLLSKDAIHLDKWLNFIILNVPIKKKYSVDMRYLKVYWIEKVESLSAQAWAGTANIQSLNSSHNSSFSIWWPS